MSLYNLKQKEPLSNADEINVVEINGVTLPYDVVMKIDGEKVINEQQILDGNVVYERIATKAHVIDFEFNFREVKTTNTYMGLPLEKAVFPMDLLDTFFQDVFTPNKVLEVKNSLLNKLGIHYLVIFSYSLPTERGTASLPCRLRAKEDYYTVTGGQSTLII